MKKYVTYFLALIVIISTVVLYINYRFPIREKESLNNIWNVVEYCQQLCIYAKSLLESENKTLNSECLSDIFLNKWPFTDWVCDVVHNPRTAEDDLPENQCKMYLAGKAKNIIEVDPNCTVIRIVYNNKEYILG